MIDTAAIEQQIRIDNPFTIIDGVYKIPGTPEYEALVDEWVANAIEVAEAEAFAQVRAQMAAIFDGLPLPSQWKFQPHRTGIEQLLDAGQIAEARSGLEQTPTDTPEEAAAKTELLALFPVQPS